MPANSKVLIKNKPISALSRTLMILLVAVSVLVCAALNLQYLYQFQVDDYFSQQYPSEQSLVIRTGQHILTASGNKRDNFSPLLEKELGPYVEHRFIGWHADLSDLQEKQQLPFTMLYEVDYEKGSTREYFYYTGFWSPVLNVREVQLADSDE